MPPATASAPTFAAPVLCCRSLAPIQSVQLHSRTAHSRFRMRILSLSLSISFMRVMLERMSISLSAVEIRDASSRRDLW
jgi:hypothetical protein